MIVSPAQAYQSMFPIQRVNLKFIVSHRNQVGDLKNEDISGPEKLQERGTKDGEVYAPLAIIFIAISSQLYADSIDKKWRRSGRVYVVRASTELDQNGRSRRFWFRQKARV